GRVAPRRPGVADHALREPRELREILIEKGVARAGEAGAPVLDVSRIARLRHLAVIDEIDARLGLFLDDLRDSRPYARIERRAVDRHAFFLREHRADEIVGPRQAAGMRRQKSLRPIRHVSLPRIYLAGWIDTDASFDCSLRSRSG